MNYSRLSCIRHEKEMNSYIINMDVEDIIDNYLLNDKIKFNPSWMFKVGDNIGECIMVDKDHLISNMNEIIIDYDDGVVIILKYVNYIDTVDNIDEYGGYHMDCNTAYRVPFSHLGDFVENGYDVVLSNHIIGNILTI